MIRWLQTIDLCYPSHSIKIVVGFGPASSADVLARLLARQLEQKLNQAVVVENRPGNSSMLAAEAVARAAPDGALARA
jgi:tripartite-type tricarboxylate transporter receptor subunit TctC